MSQSSFPRPEHVEQLTLQIERLGRQQGRDLRVSAEGLDRYHCRYRMSVQCESVALTEVVAIHFQVVERLLTSGSVEELSRLLESYFKLIGEKQAGITGAGSV